MSDVYEKKFLKDLEFGEKSEDSSMVYLEEIFGELYNLRNDFGDNFNKYDFRSKEKPIKVELKTRRCKFGQYPDLQFELGKIKDGIKFCKDNPDGRCFFVWRCIYDGWGKEGFYYWELKDGEWFKGMGGRHDRGRDEWKLLCKIKNEYINPLFSHKPTL
jgi:hypothetical protein|tara:strand:- start:230 stop:706 length:477 start_codon:yes stop_codon:yes gene_type:complete